MSGISGVDANITATLERLTVMGDKLANVENRVHDTSQDLRTNIAELTNTVNVQREQLHNMQACIAVLTKEIDWLCSQLESRSREINEHRHRIQAKTWFTNLDQKLNAIMMHLNIPPPHSIQW